MGSPPIQNLIDSLKNLKLLSALFLFGQDGMNPIQ